MILLFSAFVPGAIAGTGHALSCVAELSEGSSLTIDGTGVNTNGFQRVTVTTTRRGNDASVVTQEDVQLQATTNQELKATILGQSGKQFNLYIGKDFLAGASPITGRIEIVTAETTRTVQARCSIS